MVEVLEKIPTNITTSTKRYLYTLYGNQCAKPDCNSLLYRNTDQNDSFQGEICHIKALNEGGPRYDKNMTQQERQSADNLIILCCNCHHEIDNQKDTNDKHKYKYTVEQLKSWQREAKNNAQRKFNSMLHKVVPLFIELIYNTEDNQDKQTTQDLKDSRKDKYITEFEEKIKYNCVKEHAGHITELYTKYYDIMDSFYSDVAKEYPYAQKSLLHYFTTCYREVKSDLIQDISNDKDYIKTIQDKSDYIFNKMWEDLALFLQKDKEITYEDAHSFSPIFLTHAFCRCKIFEKKPKQISETV